jgi:hypothetical protein
MRMMMSLLVVAEPKNVKRKSFTVDKEEMVRVLIKDSLPDYSGKWRGNPV